MRKKISVFSACIFFGINYCNAQFTLECKFSTPGVSSSSFPSSDNEALNNIANQQYAAYTAYVADYYRGAARFDRKLALATVVVNKMNAAYSRTSKYPYAKQLYVRSARTFKKLEPLSQKAAEDIKQQKDIQSSQNQQDQLMQKALDDYHKAEDLVELGEREDKILGEEAQNVMIQHNLQPAEKAELKELTEKVKLAESQITKLNKDTDPLKREARELEKLQTYQFIAQQLVTEAKIVEKVIALVNPDKGSTRAITLTQTIVEKYLEEYYENGKSPATAIGEAFQKGYQKFERDELLKNVTPIKNISRVPLLIEDVVKEIDKWNKVSNNQMAVLNKINEVLEFTNDAVIRQQKVIDRSIAASKVIIERAITRHLNKKILP